MQGHGRNIIVQHPKSSMPYILKAPAALVELSPVYHLSPRLLLLTSCALFFKSLLAIMHVSPQLGLHLYFYREMQPEKIDGIDIDIGKTRLVHIILFFVIFRSSLKTYLIEILCRKHTTHVEMDDCIADSHIFFRRYNIVQV